MDLISKKDKIAEVELALDGKQLGGDFRECWYRMDEPGCKGELKPYINSAFSSFYVLICDYHGHCKPTNWKEYRGENNE